MDGHSIGEILVDWNLPVGTSRWLEDLLLDIRWGSRERRPTTNQTITGAAGGCMLIATSLKVVMAKEDAFCKVLQPFRLYMMGIYI